MLRQQSSKKVFWPGNFSKIWLLLKDQLKGFWNSLQLLAATKWSYSQKVGVSGGEWWGNCWSWWWCGLVSSDKESSQEWICRWVGLMNGWVQHWQACRTVHNSLIFMTAAADESGFIIMCALRWIPRDDFTRLYSLQTSRFPPIWIQGLSKRFSVLFLWFLWLLHIVRIPVSHLYKFSWHILSTKLKT